MSGVLSIFSSVWALFFMVLLLGGTIFIHELGHFLAARWRGLKVDRFSIGFGPKMFGWKGRDGVDYRVSWLPLGGYVALPQLSDVRALEGEPSAEMGELPTISYLDKVIVIIAGVVFNVIFALVLAVLLWQIGVPMSASSNSQVIGYVVPTMAELRGDIPPAGAASRQERHPPGLRNEPAPGQAAGLQPGDRILAVDGSTVDNFRDLQSDVALSAGRDAENRPRITLTIVRAGKTQTVNVTPALIATNSRTNDAIREIGLVPQEKMVVDEVETNSPAQLAGLREGDEILARDGQPLYHPQQLNDFLEQNGTAPFTLTVQNGGQKRDVVVHPESIPSTTPLATITLNDAARANQLNPREPRVDFVPIYPLDTKAELEASAATPVASLEVWKVANHGSIFSDLRPGDNLTDVNGHAVHSVKEMVDALNATPADQPATIGYTDASTQTDSIITLKRPFTAEVTPPEMTTRLGILFKPDLADNHVPPLQQIKNAVDQTLGMLGSLFNPHSDIGINHLTGPVGIGRILYAFSLDDIRKALWLTFIFNINLAILNLLPIPVLDGGHLLLFTIARLRRRELPLGFVSAAQGVCLLMLVGLILYVFVNDSLRWEGDRASESEAQQDELYQLGKMDFPKPAPQAPAIPVVPVTTTP